MLQRLSEKGGLATTKSKVLSVSPALNVGVRQRVALHDQRGRIVVQDHVHPREAAGSGVLLLPVEGDSGDGLVADLQEE